MDKKIEAIKLRKRGWSYNRIGKKLDLAKGTMSYWFKDLSFSIIAKNKNIKRARVEWANNIIKYNKERSEQARFRWLETQQQAEKEAKDRIYEPLFVLGVALYWAEGYKRGNWNVIFTNSDSIMNGIMLKFFTDICGVKKADIRAHIQVHRVDQVEKAVKYWSKELGLSRKYFLKTTIQKNGVNKKKNDLLPYGTLRIKINDVLLVNKIKGWIRGLSTQFGV